MMGQREFTAVEISVDDGGWMPATLRPPSTPRGWAQWYTLWTPSPPGDVTLTARATDDQGGTASVTHVLHIA